MQKTYTVLILILITTAELHASPKEPLWLNLLGELELEAQLKVPQHELVKYPHELLASYAQLPNFLDFTWLEVYEIYRVHETCKKPEVSQSKTREAIEFELSQCQDRDLPIQWFSEHHYLHPAGGSYADRYFERGKSHPSLVHLLTGDNPQHPLFDNLRSISPAGRNALLEGYKVWLEEGTLWFNTEQGWKRLNKTKWQPVAEKYQIIIGSEQCEFRYGKLCIAHSGSRHLSIFYLFSALLFLLLFLLLRAWQQRLQHNRSRRFVFQLLTHELRTPVTSLGLSIDLLRQEFDNLNDNTQIALWRLIEDYQRLLQLTEASKEYLCMDKAQLLTQQQGSIKDWVDHICTQHNAQYDINDDKVVVLPFYWLTICLNNLLINAKQHGKCPIHVSISYENSLIIVVSDQGIFPSYFRRYWQHRRSTENNLGIGLSLVSHLIDVMGGKLSIQRKPTRIKLEIPL
jgi:hypothetical protein